MSHNHFVSNHDAAKRLKQMGETPESIFEIGSPDIDIMFSDILPELLTVKKYYDIDFEDYAIVMFHPVTTEVSKMKNYIENFVKSLLEDNHNYVVIYPNNDLGSQFIIDEYQKLKNNSRFRIFPSLRFEYFLTLLKNSQFIIGNSSAGIREAPYYGIPIINIGTRQQNRAVHADVINVGYELENIQKGLAIINSHEISISDADYGQGNSSELFLECLRQEKFWKINHQKQFRDFNGKQ